ncbi:MAG: proline dehydrogenase [Bacteroidetes bacterium 4572_128]|nr:MAG: proline dehydrogenase [Bacteroidetes bacterium 4572_128]
MISLENTEVAFKSRSNAALNKAYYLFKVMANNNFVKLGNVGINTALKLHFPISWAVKPTIYKHFVGGETIEECQDAVRDLEKFNVKAILDFSMEGTEDQKIMEEVLKETLLTIENAAKDKNIPFAVFKPTAFATHQILEKASSKKVLNEKENEEFENFKRRIKTLCERAYQLSVPLMIDAEDTYYQTVIDELITEMSEKYNKKKAIIFNTLQMYRWDRVDFLKKAYKNALEKNYYLGIKFVRGAYMEKERERAQKMGYPSPIQENKENTDRDYNFALKFSIEHIDRISIFSGSHNEYSNIYLTELMEKHKIARNDERIYFSQLYGMSDNISFNLADENYNVAKYVPYGFVKNVMPYLLRRAEENTSVAGQTTRELDFIRKEKKRRKLNK